jgi:hypothetical protein
MTRIPWRVGRRFRHPGLAAQAHGQSVYGGDILTIFPFDDGLNSPVRILIRFRGRFFDRGDLLLPRCDVGRDCVLRVHDVARRVVAPCDGVSKLLPFFLQSYGGAIDRFTSCFRGIA